MRWLRSLGLLLVLALHPACNSARKLEEPARVLLSEVTTEPAGDRCRLGTMPFT